jgi:hypothetical protein
MKKKHFPKFMINMYNKKLPELERWSETASEPQQ